MSESNDQLIYRKRYKDLENLIMKEFPNSKVEYNESETLIEVSLQTSTAGKENNPRIVFHPDEEFMSDLDSDEKIFNEAIQIAKQILESPPVKNRNFQGEIHLKHGGAVFKKRTT